MTSREKIIVIALFIAITIPLAVCACLHWHEGHMDNILPVQVVENIWRTGEPLFQESGLRQIFQLGSQPASDVCKLAYPLPANNVESVLNWHAYLLLYVLAPFTAFIPGSILIPCLVVLSFMAVLPLAYAALRLRGVSIVESAAFVVLISCHPAWSYGLWGQVYVDRFFVGLGLLLLFLIDAPRPRASLIIIGGAFCTLINDRLGLVCGIFAIGYSILYWNSRPQFRFKGLLLGLALALASIFFMKFVIANQFYGSFSNQLQPAVIIENLRNDAFRHKLYVFLIFNFAFFGVFAFFDWRALLLALGVMIPNLFGNIGGAEKTGWLTHYHSTYFPVLIWAALRGYTQLPLKRAGLRRIIMPLMLLALSVLSIGLNSDSYEQLAFQPERLKHNGIVRSLVELPKYFIGGTPQSERFTLQKRLAKLVPRGATVTLPESAMPMLYRRRNLFYYPIGLDQAEYAVLPYQIRPDGTPFFPGFFSYLGPQHALEADTCLQQRLSAVFNVPKAKLLKGGYAVLRRKD